MTKPRYRTIGAHQYDTRSRRCRYCKLSLKRINDTPTCRATTILDKMAARTPLRLTAEDERIMREDWLLDPHKLPQVRIYQQLLQEQRTQDAMRTRISLLENQVREQGEALSFGDQPARRVQASALKDAARSRIRRVSRPAEEPWDPSEAGEVLLLKEERAGVEYAFMAADQIAADWAMGAMPRDSGLWFEWLMTQSITPERAP